MHSVGSLVDGGGGGGGAAEGVGVDVGVGAPEDPGKGLGDGQGLVALLVGIEELDLLVVEGALAPLADELDGVQGLDPVLNQGGGHEDRSPSQARDAVDRYGGDFPRGCVGLVDVLHQVKPAVQDRGGRALSIREGHLVDGDARVVERGAGVGGLAHADEVLAVLVLERLEVELDVVVGRAVHDEEPEPVVLDRGDLIIHQQISGHHC